MPSLKCRTLLAAVLTLAGPCASARAQALIAHWKLDASSGTTATDSSGNGRTGTVTGTATWTGAKINNGFSFNGATKIQATGLLGNPANITVAAWANLTTADSSGAEIISLGDHFILRLDQASGSSTRATLYNGSGWETVSVAQLYEGTGWHHFAATFDDASNTFALYVDGVEVASVTTTSSISYAGLGANTVIGRHGDGSTTVDFGGVIDDVRVYNYALSDTEIQELYGLLLHWKLDESSGTTANDSSAYERDGTVTGTTSWIAGRRKNAFDFNGSTKIEANTLLGQPSSFTLAAWVRVDSADSIGAEAITIGDYVILRGHHIGLGPRISFFNGSTYVALASSTSIVGAGWHHIAATFDNASDSLKLYVDGGLVGTTTTTSSVSWSTKGTTTRLATHGFDQTQYDYNGAIDDARVYSRALSAGEISELYGLIGRWKLNETSGTTAADSSGRALNGTHTNGVTVGQAGPYPGAGQYAASFDGTNDYVNGAGSINYKSMSDGYSIAGWVRLAAHVDYAAMLENGSTTDSCSLAFGSLGQVRIFGRNTSGGMQEHIATAALPLNVWKHVVGTYDGATFRVYVDGKLFSSANNTFTLGTPVGNLTLGASLQAGDDFLNGRLHDVRLYNRAIAAEEVAGLFGLVGYWKLNETSGTTAADSSGAANNGTYAGTYSLNTGGPYPGAGAVATTFNGATGSRVTVPYDSLYDCSSYTVSAWVYINNIANLYSGIFGTRLGDDFTFDLKVQPTSIHADLGDGAAWINTLVDIRSTDVGTTTQGGDLKQSRWYLVTYVIDNANQQARLYIDNDLKRTIAFTGTPRLMLPDQTMTLGDTGYTAGTPENLPGRLHGVRVYNRPISTAELAEIYGLVGHWKFNEGAGSTLADASGSGVNAAFNGGSPDWISGIYSNGLDFNGSTDDAITSSAFAPPAVGTVAYWMRSTGTPSATQRHLGLADAWEIRHETTGVVNFDLGSTTTNGFTTVATPTTSGSWYHIAAMFDAADESYAVYVNGVLDKSGTSAAALSAQSAAQLSFGTRTGPTNRVAGGMDDVRIYNRKLSPWEVYQIYGLMAWYKLDETSGTVATDSTGRGHDGTYTGSPTLNVAANGSATQGTAVAFTGANYMQATGLYDKSTSVSATAWVRFDGADSGGSDVVSLGDYFFIRLKTAGASEARASYYNGSAFVTASVNTVIEDTGWHHIAAVLDAGSTLKFYIDGAEAASVATSGAIAYTGRGSNSRIATNGWTATNTDLTGRVDDVRIFNRALKSDEVYQIYRGSRVNGVRIVKWLETR